MRILSAEALLLDVFDLHERDRIVTFLTAEWGKKRGVARGSRAKYSRFAGQLQPLAKAEVKWVEKEGRELVRISDVRLLRPATRLQEDLEGILLGSYLAEHMMEFAQENEESAHLYRLLDTTLAALLEGCDRSLAARYYEVWVLRLAGIFPPPRDCPLCGQPIAGRAAFLTAEAALVCRRCGEGRPQLAVREGELGFLRDSARRGLREMERRTPPERVLERVAALSAHVRRHFLQAELKSFRVMERTLAQLAPG